MFFFTGYYLLTIVDLSIVMLVYQKVITLHHYEFHVLLYHLNPGARRQKVNPGQEQ